MNESRNSQRMAESTTTYIDDLFDIYSKMQFIRLDLAYTKEYAKDASLEDINQDLTHLLNNRRTKPSLFGNMVGYVAKKEFTEDKGPHIHSLFIFDGQKVSKDAFKGDQIGEYWKNEITDGKGIYHNCNREKTKYAECALGMIDHTDDTKRTVLKEKAIAYLCKEEQSIDPIRKSGNERSFARGISPRKKSNAGRPRLCDSTDESVQGNQSDGLAQGSSGDQISPKNE
ncbi:inovirus-type Gp2 protein [Niveibacterium sp.]|uniref:YagK/YfjJ domain-containing protein n=1 Tax=Niveibacterium sp. TaxID=2017444 RepID=UPI0035B3EECD